jgi:hypothetical protein
MGMRLGVTAPRLGAWSELGTGENLLSRGAGAGWVFLGATSAPGSVLLCGRPSAAALDTLLRGDARVFVAEFQAGRHPALDDDINRPGVRVLQLTGNHVPLETRRRISSRS